MLARKKPTELLRARMCIIATFVAFIVVLLGAFTRLTDAGLGCPDWPLCYGSILVPSASEALAHSPQYPLQTAKAVTEMVHRYLASLLGLLILSITLITMFSKQRQPHQKQLIYLLLITVVAQGALGMWTVTLKLHPTVVMAHLLGGLILLSLLCLISLREHFPQSQSAHARSSNRKMRLWAAIALIMLVIQISLGGWTSANYAALACPDFPKCQDSWLPALDLGSAFRLWQPLGADFSGGLLANTPRVTIHLAHRLGALLTTIIIGSCCVYGLISIENKKIRRLLVVIAGLLFLQLSLGIINVLKLLPLSIALAHNGVAALLLLALVSFNFLIRQSKRRQPA